MCQFTALAFRLVRLHSQRNSKDGLREENGKVDLTVLIPVSLCQAAENQPALSQRILRLHGSSWVKEGCY